MKEDIIYTTDKIRNIAIIAHVDHGKTTMIDSLLSQTGTFRDNQEVAERIMDSDDIEKERGITILAKCTAVKVGDVKINIIDTPGHADFGGEVERVLSMVDSALLLVDSAEGVMPQTKFVLSKALRLGLRPIVVINKIDRADARPDEVIEEVFDLFVSLNADDKQLDFPILYASGRTGYAIENLNDEKKDLEPLLKKIISHTPPPSADSSKPFAFLATILMYDSYLGKQFIGKIYSGKGEVGKSVKVMNVKGEVLGRGRITKLRAFNGVKPEDRDVCYAGDIVSIFGLSNATVANTICAEETLEPIASYPIDPPTISINIGINTSPLSGLDGKNVTSTVIRKRLQEEAERNISITFSEEEGKDNFIIGGRGELQLGVLIENMRREGFELSVGRPKVIYKNDENGDRLEPIEEVIIDVDEEYAQPLIGALQLRKGELIEMKNTAGNKSRMVFYVPSRGLIGYRSEFLNATRGTGVLNRIFHSYQPYKGLTSKRANGVLIANGSGESSEYTLNKLQDRGILFIGGGGSFI